MEQIKYKNVIFLSFLPIREMSFFSNVEAWQLRLPCLCSDGLEDRPGSTSNKSLLSVHVIKKTQSLISNKLNLRPKSERTRIAGKTSHWICLRWKMFAPAGMAQGPLCISIRNPYWICACHYAGLFMKGCWKRFQS